MELVPEKDQNLGESLLVSYIFSTFFKFVLHQLVYLVLSFHVLLQLGLEIVDLVLSGLLLLLDQIRIRGLEVRRLFILHQGKLRFLVKRPLLISLTFIHRLLLFVLSVIFLHSLKILLKHFILKLLLNWVIAVSTVLLDHF